MPRGVTAGDLYGKMIVTEGGINLFYILYYSLLSYIYFLHKAKLDANFSPVTLISVQSPVVS